MKFDPPLIAGRLIRRYKRFLADVALPDGSRVVAHCPNPGSMRTCAPDDAPVWLTRHDNPRRKLIYTWELVQVDDAMVCVNTTRANPLIEEALRADRVGRLAGYRELHREVTVESGSRLDFMLRGSDGARDARCYVEVKSVTLRTGEREAAFPDGVTTRGTRHLMELMRAVRLGHRAVLLFCVNRSGVAWIRPADEIDPHYGQALREAARQGVELLAYRSEISPAGMWLGEPVRIELPPVAAPTPSPASRIKLGAKKRVRLVVA